MLHASINTLTTDELRIMTRDWLETSALLVQIEFQDVTMRYRPGLPLVLKGLTVTIPAGSKAGVVGRTGGHSAWIPFPLVSRAP